MPLQYHRCTGGVVNLDEVVRVVPLVDNRFGEVLLTLCLAVETSETLLVSREFYRIFSCPRYLDTVVGTRIFRAPIKYKVESLVRVECSRM